MIQSSKPRLVKIQETCSTDASPVLKKHTIRQLNQLKTSGKDSFDLIHPSFHVNSVLPSRHPKHADNSKIFKTHDPRGLEHLNIYGMDYSFIQPSMNSIKHCLERGYYEYIGRQRARVVIDVDLLKKFRQFELKEVLKKGQKLSPDKKLLITSKKTSVKLKNHRKSL